MMWRWPVLLLAGTSLAFGQSAPVVGPLYQLSIGTGIGDVLGPLTNHSGFPGLDTSSRLIFQRATPSASDFVDFQFNRVTTFSSTAHGNINTLMSLQALIGANDGTAEWPLESICKTNGTNGGECVSIYGQGIRLPGATDKVWALIGDAQDQTDTASFGKGALVSLELDSSANKLDTAVNGQMPSGLGNRVGANIVLFRYNKTDNTPAEFSTGLWISGNDSYVFADRLVGASANLQAYSGLDTRGVIPPTGSANAVNSVIMPAGQVIEFDGGTAANASPARTLGYSSSGTALQYQNAGSTLFSISDAGVLGFGTGLTLANASGAMALGTAGGVQAEALNVASAVNYITLSGGAAGTDPILSVGGSDAARNLVLQGKGSGAIVLKGTADVGNNQTDYIQAIGAASGGSPSIAAVGTDTNITLTIKGKGSGGVAITAPQFASLPTSCTSQPTGAAWNNGGAVNVCP